MNQKTNVQPASPHKSDDDVIELSRFFGVLVGKKWWILGITLAFFIFGYIQANITTPIYRVDAMLQVEQKSSGIPGLEMLAIGSRANSTVAETFILSSRTIVGAVVDQLNLTTIVQPQYMPIIGDWMARRSGQQDRLNVIAFSPAEPGIYTVKILSNQNFELYRNDELILAGSIGERIEQNGVTIHIADAISVNTDTFRLIKLGHLAATNSWSAMLQVAEKGMRTGVIEVAINHPNRDLAQKVLNAIITEYLLQNISRDAAEAENSLVFLEEQMPRVRLELERAENALNDYRLLTESVDLQFETQGLLNRMVELDKRINDLTAKEAELNRLFTREHPTYQALIEQRKNLTEEQRKLAEQMRELPETQQQILRLTRDVEVNQAVYLQLLNRMQELRIAKASTVGNIRILDDAVARLAPIAPRKAITMALWLILGLLGSSGYFIVRALLAKGIESTEQLELEGIQVYAAVPLSEVQESFNAKLTRRNVKNTATDLQLLAKQDPTDLAVEALRGLRTSLHFAMIEAKNKTIMISGPSPSVGKSFITANLAAILAQGGKKVLIIDGDIRRGYIHNILHVDNSYGLADFLADKDKAVGDYGSIVNATEVKNLDFIPRGTSAPNPSELLMLEKMEELLTLANDHYDFVLIDTPPLLAVTDAAIVGRYVGTTLLVARFGETTVKEMSYTIKRFALNGVTVQGAILNGIKRKGNSYYGYGYSYQYQYQYGYNYKSNNS